MSVKRRLKELGALAGAALVSFVVITSLVYPPHPSARRQPRSVLDWRRYASVGHRVGPVNAAVTIVEFSDFQCQYCRQLAATLATLYEDYPGQVAIVYRHFPLTSLHPGALPAAVAAECAGEQGRFFPYHTALFTEQDSIGILPWAQLALRAGISDTARFNGCITSGRTLSLVQRDQRDGAELHISGTPLVLVNGLEFPGAPSRAALDSVIRHARIR